MRPKIVRSVHYCPTTKKTMERKYTDMTSLDPYSQHRCLPHKGQQLDICWKFIGQYLSQPQHLFCQLDSNLIYCSQDYTEIVRLGELLENNFTMKLS